MASQPTNHEMFQSALASYRGRELSTAEIGKIIRTAFPGFNEGSNRPNDHADGNKSACWCAATEHRIFERISQNRYRVRAGESPAAAAKPASDVERERIELESELIQEKGPDWAEDYEPGTFGCHELLDRTHIVANLFDDAILNHPACIRNPQWHELASRAFRALDALYQSIGAQHLADDESMK